MKRTILLIVVIAVVAGCDVGVSTILHSVPGSLPTPASEASSSPIAATAAPGEAVQATPQPASFKDITLTGKGKKVARYAIPYAEPAIAVISHTGKSNFIVNALDGTGATIYHLVNVIGDYTGTVLFEFGEEGHSVALAIDADGTWTITIKPVTEAPVWDPTTTLKGTGDNVYQIVPPSNGLQVLGLAYMGDDNFIVHAYSPDGREGLANEIGDFTGQVGLSDGSRLIDVDADTGSWSIEPS